MWVQGATSSSTKDRVDDAAFDVFVTPDHRKQPLGR